MATFREEMCELLVSCRCTFRRAITRCGTDGAPTSPISSAVVFPPSPFTVGQWNTFRVDTADYCGNPRRSGNDLIDVKVESNSEKAHCFVEDLLNGSYSARFRPEDAGIYRISAKIRWSHELCYFSDHLQPWMVVRQVVVMVRWYVGWWCGCNGVYRRSRAPPLRPVGCWPRRQAPA